METTTNGFDLAEQDLRLRGPGDVLGTSQSGLKGVRFEEWLLDARLIHRGRQLAEAILAEIPIWNPPNTALSVFCWKTGRGGVWPGKIVFLPVC